MMVPLSWLVLCASLSASPAAVVWQPYTDHVFADARAQHRLVLLDLQAVWCHWCHVMEGTTYADRQVQAYLAEHFIAVRTDQDSRPDLANRYERYGWPATIVFDANGLELAKRSGYIEPAVFLSMLKAFVADPTPGPSGGPDEAPAASPNATLTPALRQTARATLLTNYDKDLGGFSINHKFLDRGFGDWALDAAQRGDTAAADMLRQTLDALKVLLDPAWGGMYQYSAGQTWTQPHYEKIVLIQTDTMSMYAAAAALWHNATYVTVAERIARYMETFLSDKSGAFYTSQDADVHPGEHAEAYFAASDAARRKIGVPRVDKHMYTRENGWAVTGLLAVYATTHDTTYLARARRAATWIVEHRALPHGGFTHEAHDAAGPFLSDTLAAGQAFLALYAHTGERVWLGRARDAATFLRDTFVRDGVTGFSTAVTAPGAPLPFGSVADENIAVARFANMLWHYSGETWLRAMAEQAFKSVAVDAIAQRLFSAGALLRADAELASAPLHIVVVGGKTDAAAQNLFAAALSYPTSYKRCEWYDPKEGPLPNNDVSYPPLQQAAAFVCAGKRCSLPAMNAEQLALRIRQLQSTTEAP